MAGEQTNNAAELEEVRLKKVTELILAPRCSQSSDNPTCPPSGRGLCPQDHTQSLIIPISISRFEKPTRAEGYPGPGADGRRCRKGGTGGSGRADTAVQRQYVGSRIHGQVVRQYQPYRSDFRAGTSYAEHQRMSDLLVLRSADPRSTCIKFRPS